MRVANLDGRLALVTERGVVDVERESSGLFGSDPAAVYDRWVDFRSWATAFGDGGTAHDLDEALLRAPSPRPRQVFAIGLNYAPHVAEGGFRQPESPMVFTKFPSCITGPYDTLELPSAAVDWEVELVAVVGRPAYRVNRHEAWEYLAGLTVGQDFSERVVQSAGSPAQFSIGKSFPGFGPTGPWLVTVDSIPDVSDIGLRCEVNGELVQSDSTSSLIFSIPLLVEWLSDKCRLFPGDLIFTGTPGGTGAGETPPRYLAPGDVVVSSIDGIGQLRNACVSN